MEEVMDSFLAGQDGTEESQEVMVSISVETVVWVEKPVWEEAAKAEAANKATTENCILIV